MDGQSWQFCRSYDASWLGPRHSRLWASILIKSSAAGCVDVSDFVPAEGRRAFHARSFPAGGKTDVWWQTLFGWCRGGLRRGGGAGCCLGLCVCATSGRPRLKVERNRMKPYGGQLAMNFAVSSGSASRLEKRVEKGLLMVICSNNFPLCSIITQPRNDGLIDNYLSIKSST
jgi:hypothetical protein